MIQRLVLWATLGMLCSALGYTISSWEFWCLLAMFWAVQQLAHRDGYEVGVAQGVQIYMKMTTEQQEELKNKLKELERD